MRRLVLIIFSILVLSFLPQGDSLALTIGPPKFYISADPGQTITRNINLRNEMDQTMTWYSSFESFSTEPGSGSTKFSGKKEDLASWITAYPSQVTLAASQSASIPFTIKIPQDADPGGHYAAIFWGSRPSESGGGGIGVISRMAALVFLDVSGEVVEKAEITDFRTDKKFVSGLPVNFTFTFKNQGTVHFEPEGKIIIKNIFGKTTEALDANKEKIDILPKNERNLSVSWQPKSQIEGSGFLTGLKKEMTDLHFGYYRASLNLIFGRDAQTVSAKTGFWIFPWRVFSCSIFLLAVFLFGISRLIKLYNRWIISKFQK